MATERELTAFLLGVGSWLLTGACLASEYWKLSTVYGSMVVSVRHHQNLWRSCAEDSTGVQSCRDFESLLALPGRSSKPARESRSFICNDGSKCGKMSNDILRLILKHLQKNMTPPDS